MDFWFVTPFTGTQIGFKIDTSTSEAFGFVDPPKKKKLTIDIPCEITMVTSDGAFCNTKRRDSLQNDVFRCFCFFSIMLQNWLSLI